MTGAGAPLAAIDVGTNTTRVLLARISDAGVLERLWTDTAMTRLGGGTDADGSIRPEKLREVAETVGRFASAARERGAGTVFAVATSAAREAPNGAALAAAVLEAAGVPLRIVDGHEEARLTFAGATIAAGMAPGAEAAVIDIGGGSTEVVVGPVGGTLRYARSFRIGSGRLHDRLRPTDPPSEDELRRARAEVEAALTDDIPRVDAAVIVGGTASALGRLVGERLDPAALERAGVLLAGATSAEVARAHDLDPERARILPAGLVIVQAVTQRLGGTASVGAGGIREGIILDAAAAAAGEG